MEEQLPRLAGGRRSGRLVLITPSGMKVAIEEGWRKVDYLSRRNELAKVEELHRLVREGNKVKVQELLKGGPKQPRPSITPQLAADYELNGMTSLHIAARLGKAEIAEVLMRLGHANLHAKTSNEGDTALYLAACFGHEGVVEKILQQAGAASDIMAQNKLGDTPLHAAAVAKNLHIVKLLLSKAPDLQACLRAKNAKLRTPLHYAAGCQEPSIVEVLLTGKNRQNLKDVSDRYGAIPFHFAARSGHVQSLEMLAPNDINVVSISDGFTALHYAVWSANIEAVKWLVEEGASVEQSEARKLDTPLHLAVRRSQKLPECEKIVGIIVGKGATFMSWGIKNRDGKLAIGMAEENDDQDHIVRSIVQSLRSTGRVLNGNDILRHKNEPNDATLLHYAAGHGTKDDIEWLVGTDSNLINIQDADLRTPLHWAAMKGNTSTMEALAKAGANLTQLSSKGETPLFLALEENHIAFAEDLLKWGVRERAVSRKAAVGRIRSSTAERGLQPTNVDDPDWMKGVEKWMEVFYNDKVKEEVQEELSNKFNFHTRREGSILNMFKEIPPLYLALHAGRLDMAKFFQKLSSIRKSRGGDADAEDAVNKKGSATGRTPLHWAVLMGKQDIVKKLCAEIPEFREKIKPLEEDKLQLKPIQYATKYANNPNMQDIVAELLKYEGESSYIKRLHIERQIYVDSTNAILVVATLIASVAFAGWLQPPSPYHEDNAFSKRSKGIRAFWVFISLSFCAAIGAIQAGAYGVLPRRYFHVEREVNHIRRALTVASLLMASSVTFVLCAFGAAAFVTLLPISKHEIYMGIVIAIGGLLNIGIILWFAHYDIVASFHIKSRRRGSRITHFLASSPSEITSRIDPSSPPLGVFQEKPTFPWDDGLQEFYESNCDNPKATF